jgi:Protein of unknown function (DUF3016)
MKTQSILLVAALACATTLFAAPPTTPAAPVTRVEVIFDQPEKFTDVKDSSMGTEKGRDSYLALIKEYLEERVPRYLPAGQTLTLTFTNIDLAGDFEPWRGPDFSDVRIVKDIYPPRMNFSYKLVDANGAVVKEGQEKLIEMAFQMLASPINSSDSLRYEKAMLDNWLRDKIQPPKADKAKK